MLNIVAKSYLTRITICQFIFKIELNHEKTAQLLLENVYKIQLLLLSQFCYSEDIFCSLKKTKRDAWLVLNYFCISIISVLFKRKKQKISKEPLKKKINKNGQILLLVLAKFFSCSHLWSRHFWVRQSSLTKN